MAQESLGITGIALRLVSALVPVFLTVNPGGWSYYHWAARVIPVGLTPPVVLTGIALLIGWEVFLSATMRSIGVLGALTCVGLVILAATLALGMSWTHLLRQRSGQAVADEVSER